MSNGFSNLIRIFGELGGGNNPLTRYANRLDNPYLEEDMRLGRILSGESVPAYYRKGGSMEQSPEAIRQMQLKEMAGIESPNALAVLGRISPLGIEAQGETMGATGALAKRLMQDNPNLTFTDALANVQAGFRQGLNFQSGVASPIEGYGPALGNIGGQKTFGEKTGELNARLNKEPQLEEDVAAAKVRGSGEITPTDKKRTGQVKFNKIASEMESLYSSLNKSGEIVNTENTTIENLKAAAKSSSVGQAIGKVTGSEAQSIRNKIEAKIPALISSIAEANGVSSKSLDSNTELKFYLAQATNPKLDIQSNLDALKTIKELYGGRNNITSDQGSAINTIDSADIMPLENIFSSDVEVMKAFDEGRLKIGDIVEVNGEQFEIKE